MKELLKKITIFSTDIYLKIVNISKKIGLPKIFTRCKKFCKYIVKRKEFLPSVILVFATILIIVLGYLIIGRSKDKKIIKKDSWKTQNNLYIPTKIDSFSPSVLPTSGGYLTIRGQGLAKNLEIYVGSSSNIHQKSLKLSIEQATKTEITALVPPHPTGEVQIYLNYNGNILPLDDRLTFIGDPYKSPTAVQLTGISPRNLSINSKSTITITGTGFEKTNTIKFGQGIINNIPSKDGKIIITLPSSITTAIGNINLTPAKYDISIISNNQESNFETIEITH